MSGKESENKFERTEKATIVSGKDTTMNQGIASKGNSRRNRMLYTDAKKDYLAFLRHEQGATETTIITYQSWLNRYQKWMNDEGHRNPETDTALSKTIMQRYQYSLGRAGLRPRTVRGAFHALNGLSVFLVKQGALARNEVKSLTLPKKDAARRLLVSDTEVAGLLQACERQSDSAQVALDLALISGLVYTGIRAQELLNLKLSDLNLHSQKLTVAQGKGQKARTLSPPLRFWTALEAWLVVRDKMGCNHDWLWAQDKGRRISYDWLLHKVDDMAARAGYKDCNNIKPHSLRHWFATHMLRNGANIKQIQAALGHSQAQTTHIYLHSDEQDAEAMAELADFDPHLSVTSIPVTKFSKPEVVRAETQRQQRVAVQSTKSYRR